MDKATVTSLTPPIVTVGGKPAAFITLASSQYTPTVGDVVTVLELADSSMVLLGLWSQTGTIE